MSLYYHRDGQPAESAPTVVLLHGLFGSYDNLGVVARALYTDFDVISVDLPNHGRSPRSSEFNYASMSQNLLALLDELEVEQFALLGHSMGGKVAMQLAIDHPERVSKLIVADIAPVAYEPKHNEVIEALNQVDLSSITGRKDADTCLAQYISEAGVRSFLLKSLFRDDLGFHWRFDLKLITQCYPEVAKGLNGNGHYLGPTIFIKGGDSNYITAEHKALITQYFPNSKAHIISDAGHWLHAQKPEHFNRIAARFLLS